MNMMDLDALQIVDEYITILGILKVITTDLSEAANTHDQVKDLKRCIHFLKFQLGDHVCRNLPSGC